MDISLNPELEKFIQQQLDSGLYASATEVVAHALILMAEREHSLSEQQLKLRQDMQDGMDSGPATEWNLEDFKRQAKARKAALDQSSEA